MKNPTVQQLIDMTDKEFNKSTIERLGCEIIQLREKLADAYILLSGKKRHMSDCATSCAPARTPEPCDCDVKTDSK